MLENENGVSPLRLEPLVAALENVRLPNGNKLVDLHRLRGVMEGDVNDENGNPYELVGKDPKDILGWEIVLRHCLMASLITDVLSDALSLNDEERRIANTVALLHDSGKRTERGWQRAIETNGRALAEGEIDQSSQRQRRQALHNTAQMEEWENVIFGISPRAAALITVNTPKSIEGPQNDIEKTIWFADACLRITTIMPVALRMEAARRDMIDGGRNVTYHKNFRHQLDGKNLHDVQTAIAEKLIPEFSARIGIAPEKFYDWLREKVKEKIANVELPLF